MGGGRGSSGSVVCMRSGESGMVGKEGEVSEKECVLNATPKERRVDI